MSFHTTAATRFDSFNVYQTPYKKIRDHAIQVTILVPKELIPGTHPVFVRWHGGGLTAGTAEYPNWLSDFFVPFLHRNAAIAVMPNYRLVPEHTGNDILEDISDFWTWFRTSLPTYLASESLDISPDLSRVLVHGESAGGWCALQSVLTQPKDTFKACFLQYPVVNAFPTEPDDVIMGETLPPKEVIDEFLASLVPGTVISAATPPARDFVAPMLRAYKRWGEFFGTGKHIMPDTAIANADFFVPTYIVHGKDDTNVPLVHTQAFVEKAKRVLSGERFVLVTPSGDHGFDNAVYEEEAEWLRDVLRGVEGEWLG